MNRFSYQKNQVVDNLSLVVKVGSIFGLLGANGVGKSISIACMLGTTRADGGRVSILGMNPLKDRKQLFQQVGVQFQEANYQNEIKVCELCEETAALYCNAVDWTKLQGSFATFLVGWLLVLFSILSIGMLVGGLAKNSKQASVIASILYFPMLIFSGATLPYEVMPIGLQKAADIMPLT